MSNGLDEPIDLKRFDIAVHPFRVRQFSITSIPLAMEAITGTTKEMIKRAPNSVLQLFKDRYEKKMANSYSDLITHRSVWQSIVDEMYTRGM